MNYKKPESVSNFKYRYVVILCSIEATFLVIWRLIKHPIKWREIAKQDGLLK